MAGNQEHPVVLDPWQNIIEVGWGGRYLAFSVRINRDPEYAWAQEMCGAGDVWPGDSLGVYLTGLAYMSLVDDPSGISEVSIRGSSGWEGIEDYSISGLQALPDSIAPPPWEIAASSHDNNPGTPDSLNTRQPFGRWKEVVGTDLDVSTPDGGFFKDASSVDFELIGAIFTDTPTCYEITPGGGNFFKFAHTSAQQALAGYQTAYSTAGVSVTANGGKTYLPIGIRTIGQSSIGSLPVVPGKLWVLCEKQPEV